MLLSAYSIYDRKALQYHPPFFAVQDGVAVRMVSDLANDAQTNIGTHPADYVLYLIGTYNDANGAMLPAAALVHITDVLPLVRIERTLPLEVPHVFGEHRPAVLNGEDR